MHFRTGWVYNPNVPSKTHHIMYIILDLLGRDTFYFIYKIESIPGNFFKDFFGIKTAGVESVEWQFLTSSQPRNYVTANGKIGQAT